MCMELSRVLLAWQLPGEPFTPALSLESSSRHFKEEWSPVLCAILTPCRFGAWNDSIKTELRNWNFGNTRGLREMAMKSKESSLLCSKGQQCWGILVECVYDAGMRRGWRGWEGIPEVTAMFLDRWGRLQGMLCVAPVSTGSQWGNHPTGSWL